MSGAGRTIAELLRQARGRFEEAGLDDPAADARVLIAGLLGLSATDLVTGADEAVEEAKTEIVEYPDSGKFLAKTNRGADGKAHFRFIGRDHASVDYWDGEPGA